MTWDSHSLHPVVIYNLSSFHMSKYLKYFFLIWGSEENFTPEVNLALFNDVSYILQIYKNCLILSNKLAFTPAIKSGSEMSTLC